MAPGVFGRTAGPPDNGHGIVWAVGAAALVLAIAILPNLTSTAAAPPDAAAGMGETSTFPPDVASPAPYWAVDPGQSSIRFRFTYVDRPYEGSFEKWDATIQFDPEKPEDARIRVVIPTSSIVTPEADFNDALPQGDWFDTANHPQAVFEVRQGVFKDSETQYEATGILTVKDQPPYPVRLPFTLTIDGDTARMHGETLLQRLALDIGGDMATTGDAGDDQWAGDDVVVVVDVVATRQ
jgi:polyisoprenoid-binding protein YceI